MRKAIQLKVTLWIEGEDEPAHDFAQSTTQAVRDILTGGKVHPELKIKVKKIAEDAGDDDEDADASAHPGSGKSVF